MRRLHREWADKKPFTRRVRWYAHPDNYNNNIRLVFDDSDGVAKVTYGSPQAAEFDWQQFKAGQLNTITLRQGR